MIRIHLIFAPERKEIKGVVELLIGMSVLIALFVVIAAVHIMQVRKINDVIGQVTRAERSINLFEVVKKKVDDFKAKNA